MVTRTRLSVALYVHCLSCNLHLRHFGVICKASRRFLRESVIMTQLCRNMSLNTYRSFETEMHFECVLLTYTQHIQQCTSVPIGCPNILFPYTHCAPACNRPTEFGQFTSFTHLILQLVHRHAKWWLLNFTLEYAIKAQRRSRGLALIFL